MERIFITSLIYKNVAFFIYMVNGKLEIFTDNLDIDADLIKEIRDVVNNDKKISYTILNKLKPVVGGVVLLSSLNFLGTYTTDNINNINNDIMYSNEFDLYDEYREALNANVTLSDEDRLVFLEQFEYVSNNYEYFNNIEFTLNTLRNIEIIRHDDLNTNIIGSFNIEEGKPVIHLYKNASKETLIHEIYHALKYNTYYYDKCYLYNERFIGTEEYEKLDDIEKKKCILYDLNGKFLEEAHTSLLTTKTKDVNNLSINYQEAAYIYKVYEKIIGKDIMEKNILSSNKISLFLNSLIDLGISDHEAAAIATRLDLYITFKHTLDKDYDDSYLKYQLCNDLAYVYQKKFNTTDDKLLELTTLSVNNNATISEIEKFSNNYNMTNFYEKFSSGEMSIKNILENLGYTYNDQYGVNDIKFDYFSNKDIYIYVEIDKRKVIILSLDDNNNLKFIKEELEKNPYEYKLYDDYYEFAINSYNNERYARFFAGCYGNTTLSEKERILIMRTFEKLTGDLDSQEFKDLLLFGSYSKIMNAFETKLYRDDFKKR